MSGMAWKLSIGILILVLVPASSSVGQSTSASTSGRVVDSHGAVVPAAEVLVFNPQNKVSQKAISNDEGIFVAPQLPPGSYTIIIEKPGFKKLEKTGVILSASDRLNAGDFVLA